MKLGSLKKGRDGELVVVSRDLSKAVKATEISPTLQHAIENWSDVEPKLKDLYDALNEGDLPNAFTFNADDMASPLPRAYQFLDGSAYLPHVERVRRARGAEMPPSFKEDPLMYQAVSDGFLAPTGSIPVASEEYGIDFESEVCVVTDDVPMAAKSADCLPHIKLLLIVNDVSLRNLIPAELGKGFGFMVSKPRSAFAPVAITPDELGGEWKDGKVMLDLVTHYNGDMFGHPNCGVDMQFNFPRLVEHVASTRPLAAGTIIGSGTIANQDESLGSSCLAEKRMLEIIADGEAKTPFMKFGDRVHIEMLDRSGKSIFGAIDQVVEKYEG
jgi:fumarylacetoacetate (FAA) hydrolase